MLELELRIGFDTKASAKRFFDSIKPELGEEFLRSRTKIAQKENVLEVFINASDKTALRASLNSLVKPLVLFGQLEGI